MYKDKSVAVRSEAEDEYGRNQDMVDFIMSTLEVVDEFYDGELYVGNPIDDYSTAISYRNNDEDDLETIRGGDYGLDLMPITDFWDMVGGIGRDNIQAILTYETLPDNSSDIGFGNHWSYKNEQRPFSLSVASQEDVRIERNPYGVSEEQEPQNIDFIGMFGVSRPVTEKKEFEKKDPGLMNFVREKLGRSPKTSKHTEVVSRAYQTQFSLLCDESRELYMELEEDERDKLYELIRAQNEDYFID